MDFPQKGRLKPSNFSDDLQTDMMANQTNKGANTMSNNEYTQIGWIGLGQMGNPMVTRLLDAGIE
ncbi:hypothetical protein NEILACOT_05764, partial [Neisseria lactamica ATCC 23970]